jgi:hypothetical protein
VAGRARIKERIRLLNQEHGLLLRVGLGAAALLLTGVLLWWLVNPSTPGQKTDLIQTLGTIVGGSALLFGLYFTARTLQVNQRTLQVSQEGQITERFTRAIDQLGATDDKGNPRVEVRVGGIYALERIARDSHKDYSQIIDILTAYIRMNSAWQPKAAASNDDTEQPDEIMNVVWQVPAADIQAILTVIGRRAQYFTPTREVQFADLSQVFAHRDVQYINLRNTDLRGGDLSDAHLEGAILYEAHLEGANLFGTHLEGATLFGAHLKRARLHGAYLKEAWLRYAHLEEADLNEADLEGARLDDAHLEGANLNSAHQTDS